MSADDIAHLKVTLDEVEPPVLRQIEVPLTIRLDRLHLALQAAMGWTNSHLYEIRARDVGWGVPDPDWGDGPLDARKARLVDVLEESGAKTLKYLYDFGDGWEHTIKVERYRRGGAGPRIPAPDRSQGTLSARGRRRSLGICRFSRGDHGPESRAPRRSRGMERRPLRSRSGRGRGACSGPRRTRQAVVKKGHHQSQASHLTRGPRRLAITHIF
jgi:Plasmid pRiA4b ORF-3-like protein